jgi:hypothetical protein
MTAKEADSEPNGIENETHRPFSFDFSELFANCPVDHLVHDVRDQQALGTFIVKLGSESRACEASGLAKFH